MVRVLVLTLRALFAPCLSPSELASARVTAEGTLRRIASGDTPLADVPRRPVVGQGGPPDGELPALSYRIGERAGVPLRLTASDADQVQESPRSAHKSSCGRIAEGVKPVVERNVDIDQW